jgi:hypothetical protein
VEPAEIVRALAPNPHGAPVDGWLFDDPALTLFGQGLRSRQRGARGGAELAFKVADQDCATLPGPALPPGLHALGPQRVRSCGANDSP